MKKRSSRRSNRSDSRENPFSGQSATPLSTWGLHLTNRVVQHIAVADDRPISQWTSFDDVLRVARDVSRFIPNMRALSVETPSWIGEPLLFSLSHDDYWYPRLAVNVRGCSLDVAAKVIPRQFVCGLLTYCAPLALEGRATPADDRKMRPAPGALIDRHDEETGLGRDASTAHEWRAINAAREAANLPTLEKASA